MNVDELPIHQELEVGDVWTVKLPLERLGHRQVIVTI